MYVCLHACAQVLNQVPAPALPPSAALHQEAYEAGLRLIFRAGQVVRDMAVLVQLAAQAGSQSITDAHPLPAAQSQADAHASTAMSLRQEASCGSCRHQSLVVYYAAGLSDEVARDASGGDMIYADGRPTPPKGAFRPIANFFGLWHEARRGQHDGLHRFHTAGRCVFLVDAGSRYAQAHMPRDVVPLQAQDFSRALWQRMHR